MYHLQYGFSIKIASLAGLSFLTDARLFAPSAEKNAGPIIDVVRVFAPETGMALELASGTGQHVAKLATIKPKLIWQPSDADPDRLSSINAWSEFHNLDNVKPAVLLDATEAGWSSQNRDRNFVLLVNLIHLVNESGAITIIHEISLALSPGGRLIVYGPFMRGGKLTSRGDMAFHQSLQQANPGIGYKSDMWMLDQFRLSKLNFLTKSEMPANNLSFIVEKPLV